MSANGLWETDAYILVRYPSCCLPCTPPGRLLSKSESIPSQSAYTPVKDEKERKREKKKSKQVTTETYKIQVILDNIPLKRLNRQRPIPHGHDKRMMYESLPHLLHILSLKEVLDEIATDAIHQTLVNPTSERENRV